MTDSEFTIKQGSIGASLDVTLLNDDGTPVDLTDADAVTLVLRPEESADEVWSKAALFRGDRTSGQIRYVWASADTVDAGTFFGEFAVHFTAGPITYPVDGYLLIEIEPNLVDG